MYFTVAVAEAEVDVVVATLLLVVVATPLVVVVLLVVAALDVVALFFVVDLIAMRGDLDENERMAEVEDDGAVDFEDEEVGEVDHCMAEGELDDATGEEVAAEAVAGTAEDDETTSRPATALNLGCLGL